MGIKDAYVDIGNAGLFRELANGLGVSDLEALRRAMESRSLASLKGAVREGKAFDVFSSLIKKRGGIEVIEDAAEGMDGTGRYREYFKELFARLDAYNLRSRVDIDLTTLREMEYYNGTVFDIYVGGVGVPIGGGGRYDTMMQEFGMEGAKATGFAVSVDLCVRVLGSKGFDYGGNLRPLRILFEKGCADKAIGIVEVLRRKGIACVIDAYKGEREGILVGNEARDLSTGEVFRTGGRAKK